MSDTKNDLEAIPRTHTPPLRDQLDRTIRVLEESAGADDYEILRLSILAVAQTLGVVLTEARFPPGPTDAPKLAGDDLQPEPPKPPPPRP